MNLESYVYCIATPYHDYVTWTYFKSQRSKTCIFAITDKKNIWGDYALISVKNHNVFKNLNWAKYFNNDLYYSDKINIFKARKIGKDIAKICNNKIKMYF